MTNTTQTPPKCYGDETHYSACATAPASDCNFMLGCKVSVLHAEQVKQKRKGQGMEDALNTLADILGKMKQGVETVTTISSWNEDDTEEAKQMNNAHPPLRPSCYGNVTHYSDCAMSRISNCPFIEDCRVQVAQNTYKAPDARQVGGTHYKDMPVQPWELMETILTPEEFIGFLKGTLIKYAMRAGKKPGSDDASKYEHCKAKLDEVLSKTCYNF